mgnify:CR=1 FL=1
MLFRSQADFVTATVAWDTVYVKSLKILTAETEELIREVVDGKDSWVQLTAQLATLPGKHAVLLMLPVVLSLIICLTAFVWSL